MGRRAKTESYEPDLCDALDEAEKQWERAQIRSELASLDELAKRLRREETNG